jgi:predicted metalloendopeptidase
LGLPDRSYYLQRDTRASPLRAQYRVYVEEMLALVAYPDPAASAEAILAVETAIARLHWPATRRDDSELTYNPKSRTELEAFAPAYPWAAALAQLGIPNQDFFVLKEPDAIQAMADLLRATSLETWRAYLTFHYLNDAAEVLPSTFDDLAFDFNGRVLSGQPHQRERWRRATAALNAALGEAVGKLYVRTHFTPTAKARMLDLVDNLRAAFRARIARVDWMSPETRQAALGKLAKMRVKIGYPDRWRDYSTLDVRTGDALGNRGRARLWEWRRKVARLGAPTDRDEWGMTPQTVNAYYNASYNEIVFPAAILQPPYFDPDADPAVNYGGIGGVIGHEMSHGFDDQGSRYDEDGMLRNWWQPQDLVRFKALVAGLSRQYSAYEPLPGLHLDGDATLGENIGDNSGLAIALEAYRISLHGRSAPVLSGFTSIQRFFLSWAQTYRESERDEQMRKDVATDHHSPAEFRVNGVVRNLDAWYDAFAVKPDDTYYLAPDQRIHVW